MRFEVPQFIEIEDKIIGPFTWKQFVYLAGGIGILVILYISFPFPVFITIGIPLGALSASLAFHRVNNRPFSIFLESCVNYLTRNKLYLWKRDEEQTITEMPETIAPTSSSVGIRTGQSSLKALSRTLEMSGREEV